ncbi:MAG TPA: MFS transporter [Thermomicrobiales bacterium]|nr:MFS transporter [Thermomicrobiales bacterium]
MALSNHLRRRPQAAIVEAPSASTIDNPVGRFAALDVPAFRNYFIATVVSNIGSWMQIVAQGWLVLSLTDSPFYLGLVGLVRAVPTILLSLIGGVLADRFDRRRILIVTQSVAMISSVLLAVLVIADIVTVWHILAISFVSSVFFAADNPTRQALVPDLVGRERLTSAIGLNSAAWNGAAVIGPSIAGILIAAVGVAGAFALNAASYLAVMGVVITMPELPRYASAKRSVAGQLVDGMRYILDQRAIWGILLLIAIPSLGARPYIQMMPVFARDVLGMGATGYGVLMAASGIGALVGALVVTSLGSSTRRGAILLAVTAGLGVALIAFSSSHWLLPSLALVVVVGGASTLMMSLANAVLQGLVPGEMRGRVMSVYSLIAAGFMPLGSMLLGSLGSVIGVPLAVGLGGALTIATAALSARLLTDIRAVE